MMHDAIRKFPEQLLYQPEIINAEKLISAPAILCGLGGSHLSADIFNLLWPQKIRTIHSDYGLPHVTDGSLVILSSYSGNTEEVIESYIEAKKQNLSMFVMAVGGKLIDMAAQGGVPYIQFPNVGIQPRAALGYGVAALAKVLGTDVPVLEFDMPALESEGKLLAEKFLGSVLIIYASARNAALAQNWKIKFNENTKSPAFWNVFPELNHNEMTGFDVVDSTRGLSEKFHALMLVDNEDHPRNVKRMETTAALYEARGIAVTKINLSGASRAQKIFNALLLGDWTSVYLGDLYGVETEAVPMVEEFKKKLLT